jgi:hypothetical protein
MITINLKKIIIAVILLFFISFNADASFYVGGGIGASEGAILEAGYQMNSFISIRGRGGYLPSTKIPTSLIGSKFETSGNTPFGNIDSIKLKSQTFDLGLEVTPVPLVPILSKFKIIGAVQYMDLNADIRADLNGNVKFNGTTYATSGYIAGTVSNKNKFAPYLGIGFDIINLPVVSLRTTIGATVRSFELTDTSYSLSNSAIQETDINTEIDKIRKKVDKTVIIPSVSLTARITLPNLPFIPVL